MATKIKFAEYSTPLSRIFFIQLTWIWLVLIPTVPALATVGYELNISLHPDAHLLEGIATLASSGESLPDNLRLAPQAEILEINSNGKRLSHTFLAGRLVIDWQGENHPQSMTIRYRAVFADPVPLDTVGMEDPSFGVRATISPSGTYLASGVAWFPQADGIRSQHRITVSAPPGIVAVTAGAFLGSSDTKGVTISQWHNDFPLEGLALTAGRFEITRDELDGIQLLAFLSKDNADLAPGYLDAMRRHLIFYRERLGPYPFSKFAVVENFLPTGYGMPSWTLIGKNVIRLPFLLDTSLPHEIVHSWWGNAVEVDYTNGNWAEGLTTYLADYLLKEVNQPHEALEYRRKLLRDYAALVTPANDLPLTAFVGRMSKIDQAIGYGKGAMVFYQLRREVGDETFWQGLRVMATAGNGQALSWRDIEGIFSRAAGRSLHWFFTQWLERAGAPQLALDAVRVTPTAQSWTVSGVIRQNGEPYRLDLPLQLRLASGKQLEQTLHLSTSRTPFTLTVASRPLNLTADPQSHVFRRLHVEELPATVNDLLYASRPLVIVADGQQPLVTALTGLLKGLQWQDPELVSETEVKTNSLVGRDLLLLGWPHRKELQPPLPPGLIINPSDQPIWQVDKAESAGDVLVSVLSRRSDGSGATALLLAKDVESLGRVAAKISHYGRYSLLLFENGSNLLKTTREPTTSPLSITFDKE